MTQPASEKAFMRFPKNLAFLLLAVISGCEELPSGPAESPSERIRGIHFADWTADGYATPTATATLSDLADTGANLLSIVVTAYQDDATGSSISRNDPRTPTRNAVQTSVTRAISLGMDVGIKPHVDLNDGSWRGFISPGDPDVWFADYERFVIPWAELAEANGASIFVVGTELGNTLVHESHWRTIIGRVRGVFSGELVYAASWDEAHLVPFWGALDYLGVDFYFPVARRSDPGRLEILGGWQPWLARLSALHERVGRRILITEIGYRSVDGAGMVPSAFGGDDALDLAEQADLYWAALEATRKESWIAGLFWWNWLASGSGGESNPDFTPHGKPAEAILREAWGGL